MFEQFHAIKTRTDRAISTILFYGWFSIPRTFCFILWTFLLSLSYLFSFLWSLYSKIVWVWLCGSSFFSLIFVILTFSGALPKSAISFVNLKESAIKCLSSSLLLDLAVYRLTTMTVLRLRASNQWTTQRFGHHEEGIGALFKDDVEASRNQEKEIITYLVRDCTALSKVMDILRFIWELKWLKVNQTS